MKKPFKITVLILVFIATCTCYGVISFAVTAILEHMLDAKIYWDRAPFFEYLLGFGGALFSGILMVWGVHNLLSHKRFFHEIEWKYLFILLFCFAMFQTLVDEADDLVPKFKHVHEDEGVTNPFKILAFILTFVIGYAMWPKRSRRAESLHIWQCQTCGNFNPEDQVECLNPNCNTTNPA